MSTVSIWGPGVVVALDIVFISDNINKHHQKVHKQEKKNYKKDVGMA